MKKIKEYMSTKSNNTNTLDLYAPKVTKMGDYNVMDYSGKLYVLLPLGTAFIGGLDITNLDTGNVTPLNNWEQTYRWMLQNPKEQVWYPIDSINNLALPEEVASYRHPTELNEVVATHDGRKSIRPYKQLHEIKPPIDPVIQGIFNGRYGLRKFEPTTQNILHFLDLYLVDKKIEEGWGDKLWVKLAGIMGAGALTAGAAAAAAPVAAPFVARQILLPTMLGEGWNMLQRAVTGTTTSELLSKWLQGRGMNPFVADLIGGFTNPGYWVSPLATGKYTGPVLNKLGIYATDFLGRPLATSMNPAMQASINSIVNRSMPRSAFLTNVLDPMYNWGRKTFTSDGVKIGNNRYKLTYTPLGTMSIGGLGELSGIRLKRTPVNSTAPAVSLSVNLNVSSNAVTSANNTSGTVASSASPNVPTNSNMTSSMPNVNALSAATTPSLTSTAQAASAMATNSSVASAVPENVWKRAADIFRNSSWTYKETRLGSGVFRTRPNWDAPDVTIDFKTTPLLTFRNPRTLEIRKIDLQNEQELRRALLKSEVLIDSEIFNKYPYLLDYRRSTDIPYNLSDIPELFRDSIIRGFDTTDMAHLAGSPILNNEGFIVGTTVYGKPYSQVMADEFARIPHGGAVGFNHAGATSTSSTPMFYLQLRRGLDNGTLARVFSPLNADEMYLLNSMGRAYLLNRKGRMISIPGTEDNAFNIPFKPEYQGAKNVMNGSLHAVLLADGTYFTSRGNVIDLKNAQNAYYHNGAIYDGVDHLVIYMVDLPVLTPELFVEHLNEEFLKPLIKTSGLSFKEAEFHGKLGKRVFIKVPSTAAIKFKKGGRLLTKNKIK